MARVVLINGAPGSGKSTVAQMLSAQSRMAMALDIDQIKHSLGGWEDDSFSSGLHARRLALALVDEQLRSGGDVFLGQYLARTDFIEALEAASERRQASFHEFILDIDGDQLARRLRGRSESPSRPEHAINNRLVGPADALQFVQSLANLRASRPSAIWIDANGSPEEIAGSISASID
ncbi:AAA family ATPase [Microbacterium sp. NPDC089698]|uniref:AAA family ATPase n=1 Tax=Microbacterium sp. NPDC089698 TaxID=3364200 RepID=UPI00381991DD